MGGFTRCVSCGVRLSESGADQNRWIDPDGWFVGEEPVLHAHRPMTPPDVVVVLSGAVAS